MESKLWPKQALRARLRRCEDELQVSAPAGPKLQLRAQNGLESLVTRPAIRNAQNLHHFLGIVGLRRIDGRRREQSATTGFQLLFEGAQDTGPPITRWHEGHTLSV